MKNIITVGNSSYAETLPLKSINASIEVKQIAELSELTPAGNRKRIKSDSESSCSLYTVVRDPESNSVLFVLPYIRYKENDPL